MHVLKDIVGNSRGGGGLLIKSDGVRILRVPKFFKSYTPWYTNSQNNYIARCAKLQKVVLLGMLFSYTRVYIQKLLKLLVC